MPTKPKAPTAEKAPAEKAAKAVGKAAPAKATKRRTIDWDAVERDFRTGKFTLRELGSAHKVSHVSIYERSKNHEWKQDLTEQIRLATNALLVQDLVNSETNAAYQEANTAIQIGAEVAKQVILGHRTDLKSTRNVAADLLQELSNAAFLAVDQTKLVQILVGEDATPQEQSQARSMVSKALTVNTRISSIKALADTFAKLQESERKAFSIDAAKPETPADAMADFLAGLSARGSRLPTGGPA